MPVGQDIIAFTVAHEGAGCCHAGHALAVLVDNRRSRPKEVSGCEVTPNLEVLRYFLLPGLNDAHGTDRPSARYNVLGTTSEGSVLARSASYCQLETKT
jgi:hypothetical protein